MSGQASAGLDESALVVLFRMTEREHVALFSLWFLSALGFLLLTCSVQPGTVGAEADFYTGEEGQGMCWKATWRIFRVRLTLWAAFTLIVSGGRAVFFHHGGGALSTVAGAIYMAWNALVLRTLVAGRLFWYQCSSNVRRFFPCCHCGTR